MWTCLSCDAGSAAPRGAAARLNRVRPLTGPNGLGSQPTRTGALLAAIVGLAGTVVLSALWFLRRFWAQWRLTDWMNSS